MILLPNVISSEDARRYQWLRNSDSGCNSSGSDISSRILSFSNQTTTIADLFTTVLIANHVEVGGGIVPAEGMPEQHIIHTEELKPMRVYIEHMEDSRLDVVGVFTEYYKIIHRKMVEDGETVEELRWEVDEITDEAIKVYVSFLSRNWCANNAGVDDGHRRRHITLYNQSRRCQLYFFPC